MGGKGSEKGRQKGIGGRKGAKGLKSWKTQRSESCPRLLRLWWDEEKFPEVAEFTEEGWNEDKEMCLYYWNDTTLQEMSSKIHNCGTMVERREQNNIIPGTPVCYSFGLLTSTATDAKPLYRFVHTSPSITFPLSEETLDTTRTVSSVLRNASFMICKIHTSGVSSPTKALTTSKPEGDGNDRD